MELICADFVFEYSADPAIVANFQTLSLDYAHKFGYKIIKEDMMLKKVRTMTKI